MIAKQFQTKMQTTLSRIWTRVTEYISHADNRCTTSPFSNGDEVVHHVIQNYRLEDSPPNIS